VEGEFSEVRVALKYRRGPGSYTLQYVLVPFLAKEVLGLPVIDLYDPSHTYCSDVGVPSEDLFLGKDGRVPTTR
jgi:hypothetical protein